MTSCADWVRRAGACLALTAALVFAPPAAAEKLSMGLSIEPPAATLPQPPEVAARAFILQDLTTGQVLAARNADLALEPASLTKLMTAYLVFQALHAGKLGLAQTLVVSQRASRAGLIGASRSFYEPNAQASVDDLLKGMTVQSGNDAAVALAEGVAGSVEAFVAMMNRQAQVFGLKTTRFVNPEGLSARGHVSTARELSVIATRLVQDFPVALPYYATKELTLNGVRQTNRNLLLFRDPTVDGLQTGYTEAAGYGLVATSRRAVQGGERRLLGVVLGTSSPESRAGETQKLLNWGHSAFDVVKLFEANQAVTTAPVWKGAQASVRLGRPVPLLVVVPRGQAAALKTSLVRNDPLTAPLAKGQAVGSLTVSLGAQVWQTVPLQTLEAVPSASWLGRTWDALRLGIR